VDDYDKLLGVTMIVRDIDLRRAWRRLALRWHPDRAGTGATATFQKIQAAYAVLEDPISRAAYDRRHTTRTAVRGRTPAVMLSRFCGNLNGLLACGYAIRTPGDIIELFFTADEASTGGMITIAMRVPVRTATGVGEDLFAAWLAVPWGVQDGEILPPSAWLPGMTNRVVFRARLGNTR
jgi:DnaJ-class molecular chaperone